MEERKIIMDLTDHGVVIQAKNLDMVGLATMCGALEQIMGLEAFRRGKSLDDIKDNMLDIHLGAMEALTDQIIKEGGGAEWQLGKSV